MDERKLMITLFKRIATDKNRQTIGQLVEMYERQERHISQLEMDNFQLSTELHRAFLFLQGSEKTISELKKACKTLVSKYHEKRAN